MISFSQLKDLDHFNMSVDKNKKKVLKVYPNAYVEHGQSGARVAGGRRRFVSGGARERGGAGDEAAREGAARGRRSRGRADDVADVGL